MPASRSAGLAALTASTVLARTTPLSELPAWADGQWLDAPKDFSVPVPICKRVTHEPICPPGWELFSNPNSEPACYLLIDEGTDYKDAVMRCDLHSPAKLVSIRDRHENEFVRELCGARICWLGFKEATGTETWQWLDGTPRNYMNWKKGEPNNFDGRDESVTVMNFNWKETAKDLSEDWADGTWFDTSPSFNKPVAICERQTNIMGECGEGWEKNGESCYLLMDTNMTFAEAKRRCESAPAGLVSIGTEEEQIFVEDLCGERMCWLGLEEVPGTEQWRWDDGTEATFSNWHHGEPNNFGGHDERRAMMNLDVNWLHGKKAHWMHHLRMKVKEGKIVIVTLVYALMLVSVLYTAIYIVRVNLGQAAAGGPSSTACTVCMAWPLGIWFVASYREQGKIQFLLGIQRSLHFLLLLGFLEAAYLAGLYKGIFKPLRPFAALADDAEDPSYREDGGRVRHDDLE
eukprot:TRINITY_DN36374_c0_g1_i1.p1 TRINITY_DN36374_c0_g1~~TRINITY_DN36374_c0_g1_i1.p1  ORF type:complete len:460 (+),score=87.22 TRINITY_DN36374_c0_g1_i1:116-1495(+)